MDVKFWSQIYKYVLEAYLINSEHTNIIDVRTLEINPEEFKEKINYMFLQDCEIDELTMLGIHGYSSSSEYPYIFSLMYSMDEFRDNFEVWHLVLNGVDPNEISKYLRHEHNRRIYKPDFLVNSYYDIWKKIYSYIYKAAEEGCDEVLIKKDEIKVYTLDDIKTLAYYAPTHMHDQACVCMFGISNYWLTNDSIGIRFSEKIYWEYYDIWARGYQS